MILAEAATSSPKNRRVGEGGRLIITFCPGLCGMEKIYLPPLHKKAEYSQPDLFGINAIDQGIENRGHEEIEVCKYNVDMRRYLVAEAVSEKGKKGRNIEDKNHTDVGSTSAKCSELGIL